MVANGWGVGLYSPKIASKIARIKYQNLQAWSRVGFLKPARTVVAGKAETTYTYKDLLLIRLIARLKEKGIRPKAIRVALDTIALMSEGDKDAWMRCVLFVTDGVVVAFFPDKPEWNPTAASLGTQKMAAVFFPDLIQELKDELVPPERFPYIAVNPNVLGGAPVIKDTRITTRAVVSVLESGQDPREAYPDLTGQQIDNAQAYEEFLKAA